MSEHTNLQSVESLRRSESSFVAPSRNWGAEVRNLVEVQNPTWIYAFMSGGLNDANGVVATKVGYTGRNPHTRIAEWRSLKGYADIATLGTFPSHFFDDNGQLIHFDDHSVHSILMSEGFEKLIKSERYVSPGEKDHVSNEFFIGRNGDMLTSERVQRAIAEVVNNYRNGNPRKLNYYPSVERSEKVTRFYKGDRELNELIYQKNATDAVVRYVVDMEQRKVLLWAPARSGKSIMSAKAAQKVFEVQAKKTGKRNHVAVVVTGKTDVIPEFRETFTKFKPFAALDSETNSRPFVVLAKEDLKNPNAIDEAFTGVNGNPGADNVVILLSLQDLSGGKNKNSSGVSDKFEHKQLIGRVDLVIADEAHFGMFGNAEEFKRALSDDRKLTDEELGGGIANKEQDAKFTGLNPNYGYIYVTATPFNILQNGSEFKRGKNLVVVDPDAPYAEAEKWDKNHGKSAKDNDFSDSPHLGLVKKYFWALNVEYYAMSFFPYGSSNGINFTVEQRATQREFCKIIFSTQGTNEIPGLFGSKDFQDIGMGRNSVLVLPRQVSCQAFVDALEGLTIRHPDTGEIVPVTEVYDIFNLPKEKNIDRVKDSIASSKKRTITLTVAKMLQGVSVPKWDTIFFLAKSASVSQRIQAQARVNTPWVETIVSEDGTKSKRVVRKGVSHVIDAFPNTLYEVKRAESANYAQMFNKRNADGGFDYSYYLDNSNMGTVFDMNDLSRGALTSTDIRKKFEDFCRARGPMEAVNSLNFHWSELDDADASMFIEIEAMGTSHKNGFSTTVATIDLNAEYFCSVCKEEILFEEGDSYRSICDDCQKIKRKTMEVFTSNPDVLNAKKITAQERDDELLEMLRNRPDLKGKDDTQLLRIYRQELLQAKERAEAHKSLIKSVKSSAKKILLYVALSDSSYASFQEILDELEITNDEPSSHTLRARTMMNNIGVPLDAIRLLRRKQVIGEDFDDTILSISNKYHGVNGEAEFATTEEMLKAFWGDMNKIASNEVFTPLSLARLNISRIGLEVRRYSLDDNSMPMDTWSDADFTDDYIEENIDFWRNTLSTPNMSILNMAAKSGVFVMELCRQANFALDCMESRGENVDTYRENLPRSIAVLPTSGVAYEILVRVFKEYGLDQGNIIWSEYASDEVKKDFALHLVRLLSSFNARNYRGNRKHEQGSLLELSQRALKHKILELSGDKLGKILSEGYNEKFFEFLKNWLEFGKIMNNTEVPSTGEELRAMLKENPGLLEFDALVGNPPYQTETGEKTVTNIFHEFQLASNYLSKVTCLIYPADRWIQRSGKGMSQFGYDQANSRHLVSVDYWSKSEQLFPGVDARSISVVLMDKTRDNDGSWLGIRHEPNGDVRKFTQNLPGDRIISFDPDMNEILDTLSNSGALDRTLDRNPISQKFFGLESNYVNLNPNNAVLCNDDFTNKPTEGDWILAILNDKPGPAGRAMIFWIPRNEISRNRESTKNWKVCISSMNTTGERNRPSNPVILPNDSAYGRVLVGIGFFSTAKEACNFHLWVSTDIFKYLSASSGSSLTSYAKNVPDIGDFTDSNELFRNSPSVEELNARVLKKLGLEYKADYISQWVKNNITPAKRDPFWALTDDQKLLFQ